MPSKRFIENETFFLDYAWTVFQSWFLDRASFQKKYDSITTSEKKNEFLRLASYYLFFVKEGGFSNPKYDVEEIGFVDQTYKFIAIVALIESMYEESEFIDFYQWLMRNKKTDIFPVKTPEDAGELHRTYKAEYGSTSNIIRFFRSLDDSAKLFMHNSLVMLDASGTPRRASESEDSIDVLSKLLYQIRSDFMHRAVLVLEFDDSAVYSIRDKKPIESLMKLEHLLLLFESGLLKHFGITPDTKRI